MQQLNRFDAANEANEREKQGYVAKQQQLEVQIQRALEDIDAKKRELQAARVVRQHNEEYEVRLSFVWSGGCVGVWCAGWGWCGPKAPNNHNVNTIITTHQPMQPHTHTCARR